MDICQICEVSFNKNHANVSNTLFVKFVFQYCLALRELAFQLARKPRFFKLV